VTRVTGVRTAGYGWLPRDGSTDVNHERVRVGGTDYETPLSVTARITAILSIRR